MSFLTRLYPPMIGQPIIPSSIDPTGATDVSVPLQAFFDSRPANTVVLGPAGANYRVEFGINIESRTGLHLGAVDPLNPPRLFQTLMDPYGFNPGGSTHKLNRNRHVLAYRFGGGHTLNNWILKGSIPTPTTPTPGFDANYEAQHALIVAGVNGFTSANVRAETVAGDFIFLNDPVIGPNERARNLNITIEDFTGRYAGRQGISPCGVRNGIFRRLNLRGMTRSFIDMEPAGGTNPLSIQHMVNVLFAACTAQDFGNNWFNAAGDGEALVSDITVEDNTVIGRPLRVDIVGRRTNTYNPGQSRYNFRFARNRAIDIPQIEATGARCMHIAGVRGLELIDNYSATPGGTKRDHAGVWFNETCGITYSGNFWGGAQHDHEVTTDYDRQMVTLTASAAINDLTVQVEPLTRVIPRLALIGGFSGGRKMQTTADAPVNATSLSVKKLLANFVATEVGEHGTLLTTLDGANLEWPGRPNFWGCAP